MDRCLSQFLRLSHFAARRPHLVQGGGGNCSVKYRNFMIVKASGVPLNSVSREKGYSVVSLETGAVVDGEDHPSLEAHLHHLLGRYVIHTHPILVAALVCSREGKDLFRKIFPGSWARWVPYASPGKPLALQVKKILKGSRGRLALFLENHGLFVSAANEKSCMALHKRILQRLRGVFSNPTCDAVLPSGRYLTPDHAVYSEGVSHSSSQKRAVREINFFAGHALGLIRSKGWHAVWLRKTQVTSLRNMKAEKYRKELLGRS